MRYIICIHPKPDPDQKPSPYSVAQMLAHAGIDLSTVIERTITLSVGTQHKMVGHIQAFREAGDVSVNRENFIAQASREVQRIWERVGGSNIPMPDWLNGAHGFITLEDAPFALLVPTFEIVVPGEREQAAKVPEYDEFLSRFQRARGGNPPPSIH